MPPNPQPASRAEPESARWVSAQYVGALIRTLKDDDGGHWWVPGNAASTLGELGPPAKEAIPELRKLLKSDNLYARQHAALALWRIDHDTNVIPLLVSELRKVVVRVAPGVRRIPGAVTTCGVTLEAFAEMGSLAKDAEPLIIEVMNNAQEIDRVNEKYILRYAHKALATIDPELAKGLAPIPREEAHHR